MLIDLSIAGAWIAMSAAGAVGLSSIGRLGAAGLAATVAGASAGDGWAPTPVYTEPAHEELYPPEPALCGGGAWR